MPDESSDDDAPPEASSSRAPEAWPERAGRANKNRPSQQKTKRKPVPTFRIAPGLRAEPSAASSRDPRFDPLGADEGELNEAGWRKSYEHVFAAQFHEVQEIKQTLRASSAASKRAKQRGGGEKRRRVRSKVLSEEDEAALRLRMGKIQNRLRADDRKEKLKRVKAAVKKEEVEAVKGGKRPFFAKAAVLKERELIAQYEELKSGGQVEKFLTKRRRKLSNKQHKGLPGYRDGESEM